MPPTMDFAPYQSSPPETTRRSLSPARPPSTPSYFKPASAYTYSPPPSTMRGSGRAYSPSYIRSTRASPPPASPPASPPPWGSPWAGAGSGYTPVENGSGGAEAQGFRVNLGLGGFGSAREAVEQFETSLPLRLDYEAMLAYLLLPPAGSVLLLIFEHKSDYVRFHAWQGSLLFSALVVVHFVVSFSRWLSWVLFGVDVGLMGWLSWRAYRDADTLDRCEVPYFGRVASRILDEE